MRIILITLITLLFISCSKYKSNQPCTISFTTNYLSSTSNSGIEEQFSGSMSISRLTFIGEREEGGSVEIEKTLGENTISLAAGADFGFKIDIPVGVYTSYKIKIRLNSENSLVLKKIFTNQNNKPITLQFDEDLDLIFSSKEESSELKKKKNYTCDLIWDYDLLFNGITSQAINAAPSLPINGVQTILIDEITNSDLFLKIKKNIGNSLQVKIQ